MCTVNGLKASPRQLIKDGDIIVNRVHRHEPAVTAEPIKILHRNEEMGHLVVVKPGSIPVHAAGRYFKSTLIEMLKSDHGIETVYTANRLDRLTSGIMVCATRKETARKLSDIFASGEVRKNYVCRVRGQFPGGEPVECTQPILAVDRQSGVNIVHPLGKQCKTIFHRLSYDAHTDTSVVWCKPITGRTHQIRVHVQYLGHPISNDPVYGHSVWESPAGASQEQMTSEEITLDTWKGEGGTGSTGSSRVDNVIAAIKAQRDGAEDWARWKDEVVFGHLLQEAALDVPEIAGVNAQTARPAKGEGEAIMRDLGIGVDKTTNKWLRRAETEASGMCEECKIPLLPDPRPEELFIYLHAMKYETDEWSYQDELPWWAREDWTDQLETARRKRDQEGDLRVSNGSAPQTHSQQESGSKLAPVPISKEFLDPAAAVGGQAVEVKEDTSIQLLERSSPSPKTISRRDDRCLLPLLFSTFEGMEDFAEHDLQRLLNDEAQIEQPSLDAWFNSGHVYASPENDSSSTLLAAWDQGLIRSAESAHIVVCETALPKSLGQRLIEDRKSSGRSRRGMTKQNQAYRSQAQDDAETMEKRMAELRARNWRSSELPQSEEDLLKLIEKVWDDSAAQRDAGLETWKKLRPGRDRGTFRCTFKRSGYLLPTLVSAAVEREVGEIVWPWLNGSKRRGDPDLAWSVDLVEPDLNIVFTMVPHWKNGGGKAEDIGTGPQGGIFVLIDLGQPAKAPSFRPEAAKSLITGGTALAPHRSYLLANLIRVPPVMSEPLRLLEPCAGYARIPVELVATLQRLELPGKVYACDIDIELVEAAREIRKLCDIDERELDLRVLDATDASKLLPFVEGEDSVDAIVTDLPWGHRVLTKAQLVKLYKMLLEQFARILKPNGHAVLMTAEYNMLSRFVADHQARAKREGRTHRLTISPISLPSPQSTPVSHARRWGEQSTEENGGMRPAKCGYMVGIFDLRKEAY